jgi:hypothetical protein
MARPRTPKAKAKATGRDKHDKARFAGRNEPVVHSELGPPFDWLTDTENSKQREAWEIFRGDIPWLNASHRLLVAEACTVLGRMIAGKEVGVQALNLLRQCLGQMGATPADASKAGATPDGEKADPADEFFSGS